LIYGNPPPTPLAVVVGAPGGGSGLLVDEDNRSMPCQM
jgi:hypothetical protein